MDLSSLVLSHLADSSVRALALAAVALAALWLGRVRSVSVRHAAWTVTLGSMLLLPCLTTLVPDLPLRVLPSRQAVSHGQEVLTSGRAAFISTGVVAGKGSQPGYSWLTWRQAGLAVYTAGLFGDVGGGCWLSCVLVRRLIRSCVPVLDAPGGGPAGALCRWEAVSSRREPRNLGPDDYRLIQAADSLAFRLEGVGRR